MSAAPSTEVAANATVVEDVPGLKIYVGNLAYATTDEGLKAFVTPAIGDVLQAQVIMRGTRSAGYGFVTVSDEATVRKAIDALDKKELDGRTVSVQLAKPAEIKDQERTERRQREKKPRSTGGGRRGDKAVPGEVTEAEANGEVEEVAPGAEGEAAADGKKKRTKKPRKPRAKKTAEGAEAAAEAETKAPAPAAAALKPKRAPRVPRPAGEPPVGEPSKSVVFVANLGFKVDDDALKEIFTNEGITVRTARVVRRRFGQPRRSKGYGFVDVGDEAMQAKAVEVFNGKDVNGRELAVKIAVNAAKGSEDDDEPSGKIDLDTKEAEIVAH